jgi:zinc protease
MSSQVIGRSRTRLAFSLFAAVAVALLACARAASAAAPTQTPSAQMVFGTATQVRLRNGVIVASQPASYLPIVGIQLFVPAGLAQQPPNKAGVAGLTAALVLHTPVDGKMTLLQTVAANGGSISYTLDPADTRYYLECSPEAFGRLLHALRVALTHPDLSQLAAQRAAALARADALTRNPLEAAYAMVRQVRYRGTGFAQPDHGSSLTLSTLGASDVNAFVTASIRGNGTIVALEGAVTQAMVDSASQEFQGLPAASPAPVPTPAGVGRQHQVIAHRDIAAPWVAIAYAAPTQYSPDFAAMLVIEAMLGSGGDVHALNYESDELTPTDFIGAYYQYEATPGSMIVFLGGEDENLDQSVRDLTLGIARLRGAELQPSFIDEAKKKALGDYYLSVTRLDDLGWLLGRAAASPEGVAFENNVPQRITSVTAEDIRRVARRYLQNETIAIVLPQAAGQ